MRYSRSVQSSVRPHHFEVKTPLTWTQHTEVEEVLDTLQSAKAFLQEKHHEDCRTTGIQILEFWLEQYPDSSIQVPYESHSPSPWLTRLLDELSSDEE